MSNVRFRALLGAAFMAATTGAAIAQPGAFAGGGLHFTREDAAWARSDRGYRGIAGLQVAGDHFALVLQGGYAAYGSRGERAADSSLPRGETRLFEAQVLPKFYLRRGAISAYLIGGGGPVWTSRETWTETGGSAGTRATDTRVDLAFQYGFGVEAEISETWKVGLAPLFHSFYEDDDERAYGSFVVYLML